MILKEGEKKYHSSLLLSSNKIQWLIEIQMSWTFLATEIHKQLRSSWCNVFGSFMLIKTSFVLLLGFFSSAQICHLFWLFSTCFNCQRVPQMFHSSIGEKKSLEINSWFFQWQYLKNLGTRYPRPHYASFTWIQSSVIYEEGVLNSQSWKKANLRKSGLLASSQIVSPLK